MKNIVILADGKFPEHPVPLRILEGASIIICSDGSAAKLVRHGLSPSAIVGDMDSLGAALQERYKEIIHKESDQETNDLTKAFKYSLTLNPDKITILGATGEREDHTLGNISLLSQFRDCTSAKIEMYTDCGRFIALRSSSTIYAPSGSQVSIFSLDTNIRIISKGLKYPLNNVVFDSWWKGTLNETSEESFTLDFADGRVILYIVY